MRNRHTLSILVTIWLMVNTYDPFYRKVWVNIEADNIRADSAGGAYHVAQAVSSAVFEAMLFALTDQHDNRAVSTLDVEVRAEASTHTATLSRTAFPMDTAVETDPEPAAICAYSPEVERYIYRFLDDVRADISEMLKALAAAHFGDTDGGEGESYVVTRRSVTEEP
ncbi:hypothetical protein [Pseudoflavonifractor phocaeensis]|uniref:hypothetical protein n=1 Tax=Pseudoflavonifractor phocaeensis TaxID=1870988 RepID=UPI001955F9D4|nr:hypothetical protein [Pseudoflavonifractor phocaeensis]MBM6887956.1 hypothetical protein [Pseudoflavonifractor phocaeensis]